MEKPIIFSTEMVKAILDGRKTQTRRVINPQPFLGDKFQNYEPQVGRCPYGQADDRLWLKHRYDLFDVYYAPIEGFSQKYAAGTDGHIYRMDGTEPQILKEDPTGDKGYLAVSLSDGLKSTQLVHRLVVKAFYGLPPADLYQYQTRHLDGNNQNNLPVNLDWGTQEDNWADRKYHGRGMGEQHHNAKLTVQQVLDIRISKRSQRQLATQYGVSQATIRSVMSGETWKNSQQQHCRNYPAWQPWKSPLFMPRWASRITLEIAEVRVERLQEIKTTDIIAEGYFPLLSQPEGYHFVATYNKSDMFDWYRDLWDSLNAKRGYGWDTNPWVWVVSFKTIGG